MSKKFEALKKLKALLDRPITLRRRPPEYLNKNVARSAKTFQAKYGGMKYIAIHIKGENLFEVPRRKDLTEKDRETRSGIQTECQVLNQPDPVRLPEYNDKDLVRVWETESSLGPEYDTRHYLLRAKGRKWDTDNAYRDLCELSEKAMLAIIKQPLLYKNPHLAGIYTGTTPIEKWLGLVCCLQGNSRAEQLIIEDVFSVSLTAYENLSARIPVPKQKPRRLDKMVLENAIGQQDRDLTRSEVQEGIKRIKRGMKKRYKSDPAMRARLLKELDAGGYEGQKKLVIAHNEYPEDDE